MQNFTWAASAMQRAFAAIPAVELAYYASLAAMLMLFFARCGEVHAFEDFVLILAVAVSYHSMRHADYPYYLYLYQLRAAGSRLRAGSGSPSFPGCERAIGSHERGARVWAAFAICFSRPERAHHDPGTAVAALSSQRAAHHHCPKGCPPQWMPSRLPSRQL